MFLLQGVAMKFLIAIALVFCTCSNSVSQFGSYQDFFPLQTGNTWYYKSVNHWLQTFFYKKTIVFDTLISGNKYYVERREGTNRLIRYDSTRGNLLQYFPGAGCYGYLNDKIIDSLASSVGNVVICELYGIYTKRCDVITSETVFGMNLPVRGFYHDGLGIERISYAYGIGPYYSSFSEPPPYSSYTYLLGCKINNVVYGDTNLVGIQSYASEIPGTINFVRNFPNPFNPETVIEFRVNSDSYGKAIIRIFNAAGIQVDEIFTEVNGNQINRAVWQAGSQSGGVYFCEVRFEGESGFTKMLLIK